MATPLQGAARLATDAAAALADLVEALHHRISPLEGWGPGAVPGRTSGVTGLVYRTVRGTTRLVGGSIDALLGALAPILPRIESVDAPGGEAVASALNGIVGDHLAATGNPLAIPMAFRREGRVFTPDPGASPRILVLIHGLCMGDLQWKYEGHDHGEGLAKSLGMTAVYLRYNTGLRIGANGRLLAEALQDLVDAWPVPVERIVLLGHSMGGMVARSAIDVAQERKLPWARCATDLVCLGSPHEGAPLERLGNWLEKALGTAPYASPLARLGSLRSAGILDLRHGAIREDGRHVPLPKGVRCFAIAGSLGHGPRHPAGRVFGDGLVPVRSALGEHPVAARALRFPKRRQAIAWQTNHLQLLGSPEVFRRLERWLGG